MLANTGQKTFVDISTPNNLVSYSSKVSGLRPSHKEQTEVTRGGAVPYKGLLGMCRWMGSHLHDWIDYNGVANFLIWGVREFFMFTVSKGTRMFVL